MMAWPNILVMTAQASTGLIETWWVSHLGADSNRHGIGLPRLHDDADALGRRDRWRHLVGGRACAWRRPARRRRFARAARDPRQPRPRRRHLGDLPRLRPADLRGDGRPGRLARRGARLLECRLRRQRAGVAAQRARERHSRHRQHARALARGVPRHRRPRAALAMFIFGWGPGPRARHRRRRASAVVTRRRSPRGPARLVHPLRALRRQAAPGAAAGALLRRHPARRRRRRDQHASDDADGRPHDRARRRPRRPRRGRRLRHRRTPRVPC